MGAGSRKSGLMGGKLAAPVLPLGPSSSPVSLDYQLPPFPPSFPMRPWHEYDQDAMAALALLHEIAKDPNQQYSEACRKAKAFLTKFNLWVTA